MPVTVGTNSYASESELTAYATDRGVTIAGDKTVMLIKAMDWLENHNFVGAKEINSQPLKWPRYNTGLSDDVLYDANDVPVDIKQAQMACALIYDKGGDPLATIGRAKKRIKVDVIETEYDDKAVVNPIYPVLNLLIAQFINQSQSGGTSFAVNRG
jgi:hypothetical protein